MVSSDLSILGQTQAASMFCKASLARDYPRCQSSVVAALYERRKFGRSQTAATDCINARGKPLTCRAVAQRRRKRLGLALDAGHKLLQLSSCSNLPAYYSASVLKEFDHRNVAPACSVVLLLLLCLTPSLTTSAAVETNPANGLLWADDSGEILFTAAGIVRFDWERQVFELQRERALDLMAYLVPHRHLQREFSVRDSSGEIYSGRFFSLASSQTYDGPTILTGKITGMDETPPLFAIQGGYPGNIGPGAKRRFNRRLHDDLEKAGLLKTISPTEMPRPIERIHTEWFGDRDKIRLRAEIFPETFRLGSEARIHLFYTPGLTPPPTFDTVKIQTILSQTNGFFCNTAHSIPDKLTPETIKFGFHLMRWKPWGPVYGAIKSRAKSGPAKLSLRMVLRQRTPNGHEVVCSVEIPSQELMILPPVEATATPEAKRTTN
jgi:hypothetical protein